MKTFSFLKSEFLNSKAYSYKISGNTAFLFFPAIFLVGTGLLALVAPQLLIAILASFLIFGGIFLFLVAYKVLQLKRKVEEAVRKYGGKVVIQGVQMRPEDLTEEIFEPKRDIFH